MPRAASTSATPSTSASVRWWTRPSSSRYGVLTTVIVLFVGGLALYASFVGPITIDMSALSPWLLAVAIYVPFLPLAALAWIEPDAPSDVEA